MPNIMRSKTERRFLDKVFEPAGIDDPIANNVTVREARDESRDRFKHRTGGRASMTVPELPWKQKRKGDK